MNEERLLPATPVHALTFLRHAIWYLQFTTPKEPGIMHDPARMVLARAIAHVCMDADICIYCANQPEIGTHCHFCGRG